MKPPAAGRTGVNPRPGRWQALNHFCSLTIQDLSKFRQFRRRDELPHAEGQKGVRAEGIAPRWGLGSSLTAARPAQGPAWAEEAEPRRATLVPHAAATAAPRPTARDRTLWPPSAGATVKARRATPPLGPAGRDRPAPPLSGGGGQWSPTFLGLQLRCSRPAPVAPGPPPLLPWLFSEDSGRAGFRAALLQHNPILTSYNDAVCK